MFVIFVFNMKRSVYILAVILLAVASCTREEPPRTTGIDTIDNIRYMSTTYYVYGFNFSTGKVASTEETPGPDITVDTVSSPPYRLILQTNSLRPSFAHVGNYATEAEAKSAFDGLKTFTPAIWTDLADPVTANQVWVFRSGQDRYTKIRIVSINRRTEQGVPVAEVTFQWAYQADGSLTFP